jgi:ATP-dependent DNA helicase RecG
MNIARGPDEAFRPVNAGLMFFSKEPHRFFERAWIELVLRKDEAGKAFPKNILKDLYIFSCAMIGLHQEQYYY